MKIVDFAGWIRKPLVVCGLVAALTIGNATAANATNFDFSYSGSGISVSGTVSGTFNGQFWDLTSITGTHTDGSGTFAITGLWDQPPGPCFGCDNYLAGVPWGSPGYYPDQMDIHFLIGSTQYAFGWIPSYAGTPPGAPGASEGPISNVDYLGDPAHNTTGRCYPGNGCSEITEVFVGPGYEVPEINASAGLGALAALLGFALIFRELFQRRRTRGAF